MFIEANYCMLHKVNQRTKMMLIFRTVSGLLSYLTSPSHICIDVLSVIRAQLKLNGGL